MREWWRYYVEDPIDQLNVNWDKMFLYMWLFYAVKVVLTGGASV